MKADKKRESFQELGGVHGGDTEIFCLGSFLLDSLLRMLLRNLKKVFSAGLSNTSQIHMD